MAEKTKPAALPVFPANEGIILGREAVKQAWIASRAPGDHGRIIDVPPVSCPAPQF